MTCAFSDCAEPCCLLGGCVVRRWAHVPKYEPKRDAARDNSPALVGTRKQPAKRRRKALPGESRK